VFVSITLVSACAIVLGGLSLATQVGTVENTVSWTKAPGFAISPDSRRLLCTSLESSDADLMLVDNFR